MSNHSNISPKPFLKWAGGKTQLLPTIDNYLPGQFNEEGNITYIEPFVGGGALLFYLLSKYSNIHRAIINDINPHLIHTYQVIKNYPDDLILELKDMQTYYHSLPTTEEQKKYFLNNRLRFNRSTLTMVEEAALMIFLNRTCFNGLYRENSKGEFNVAFGRYTNPCICDEELIKRDSEILQKVEILHGDFSQIESYATDYTFVYFDPPYRPIRSGSFTSYAKENFNDKEQRRLKELFSSMSSSGYHLLLSNSDGSAVDPENTFLDTLYSEYKISRVYARRSISRSGDSRGPIPELLIRNYHRTKTDDI